MSEFPSKVAYKAVPNDVEPVSAQPAPSDPTILRLVGQRQWYKHWLSCCGDCDSLGWGSCLLGYFCPCVAFGINKKRAFSQSAILWGLLFFFLYACMVRPCEFKDVNESESRVIITHYGTREERHSVTENEIEVCHGIFDYLLGSRIAAGVALVAAVVVVTVGTLNRMALRKKYGLEGSTCTDCLLWTFCTPCTLCQETRTLWYNSVKDGVWNGPSQVYELDAIQISTGMPGSNVAVQQAHQEPGAPATVPMVNAYVPPQQ